MIPLFSCLRRAVPLAFAASMLAGQDGRQPAGEDVFVLPEFVVIESSRGYTATNSMTGTFLNTPLKDSPFAIDVFTPDLIADTGSTDMREILAYDSGLQLENTISAQTADNYSLGTEFDARAINNSETDIVTRGFRAPTLKNGFFTKTRVDTINIERVERAGGPQSLLYGIGSISGITNVITKRPLPETRNRAEVFAGSNDFYRATFETTGPLLERDGYSLGYIASAAAQTEGDEFPDKTTETLFFAPTIQLKAFDNKTSLLLGVETGWRREEGTGFADVDYPYTSAGAAPFPFGAIEVSQSVYKRQTNETPTYLRDHLGRGWYVNLGGPDVYTEDDILTGNLELTQQIGDHFRLLVALNDDRQNRDRLEYTKADSLITFDPGTGNINSQSVEHAFGKSWDDRVTGQARVALLGSFEFLGGTHSFVAGRQEITEHREVIEFPEGNSISGQLWPLDGTTVRYQDNPLTPPRWENRYNDWYQGNYLVYQGSVWKGRVNPVLGYRWDRTHSRFLRTDYDEETLAWGPLYDPLVGRGSSDGYSNNGEPFEVETPTAGLSVSLNEAVSVYGTYGEGIALNNVAQRDGLGRGFPPEFTRNREVGAKVTLWKGRITGRVTYFELQKRGGIRYSFYAPNPARGNFNPDQPVTAALEAGTVSNPKDLRRFMEYLGLYSFETNTFSRLPLDLPGVQRVFDNQNRPFFIFPFGDPDNPGKYDPATNNAPDGYGQDLVSYIRHLQELSAAGEAVVYPQYMWTGMGNHPGEDRGAYHNFDEVSQGYEARLQITPVPNWQMILSYTYNTVQISNGMSGLVDPGVVTGIEPWFIYLAPEDFADPERPSTYNGGLSAGVANTDVPVHSLTFWTKYEFTDGRLAGLDLRFGARYSSERAAQAPWAREGGAFNDAIERGLGDNTKAPVPAYTLYDAGLGYKWRWRGLDWRANVNVRNVFDKRELTALSGTRTVGGLPAVTYYVIEGRDVRVSLGIDF